MLIHCRAICCSWQASSILPTTYSSKSSIRHSVPHTTNPFTAPVGKKAKEKRAYCTRHITLMAKWFEETGDKLFKHEAELWQQKLVAIEQNKL